MGSVQFRNSHRGQLVARWHPDKAGIVVVTDEKGSLLVERGPHFCYRRNGLQVEFLRGEPNPFGKSPSLEDVSDELSGARLQEAVSQWWTN